MIEPHHLIGCSLEEAEKKIGKDETIMIVNKDNKPLIHIQDIRTNRYKVSVLNGIIHDCKIG